MATVTVWFPSGRRLQGMSAPTSQLSEAYVQADGPPARWVPAS